MSPLDALTADPASAVVGKVSVVVVTESLLGAGVELVVSAVMVVGVTVSAGGGLEVGELDESGGTVGFSDFSESL